MAPEVGKLETGKLENGAVSQYIPELTVRRNTDYSLKQLQLWALQILKDE